MPDRSLAAEVARLRRDLNQVMKGQRVAHGASIEGAALQVNDATGTLRAVVGVQPDGTVGVVAHNGPPPGALSAPTATPSIAGLRVTWDGATADGTPLPADFDHAAVHVSTSNGFTPSAATFVGTITRAGDGGMLPVTPLPYTAHYVRIIGVNTSGAQGAPSAQTAGTPVQVEGPDLTAGSVTAGHIAAGAIEADKLAAILVVATRILSGDPDGARVELNGDGLSVYNSADQPTVILDAATGDATFSGDIVGSTITGSTLSIEDGGGNVQAQVAGAVGLAATPGFITYSTSGGVDYYSALTNAGVSFGVDGAGSPSEEGFVGFSSLGSDLYELLMSSGRSSGQAAAQVNLYSSTGSATEQVVLNASRIQAAGVFKANNIAFGSVTITPSGVGVPTSATVTGLSVAGAAFVGFATASTTVPGDRTPTGNAGVTGVSVSAVTGTGLTVWVNRQNTTPTIVNWMIRGD